MLRPMIKFFVFSLFVIFLSPLAYADEVGKFVAIEGRVDILKLGEEETALVREGDIVSTGDIIRTKSFSKSEMRFNDKTILQLAENTRVEIKEYKLDGSGFRRNAIINLQRGEIRAFVSKSKDAPNFFVNTPNASGSVKGTDVFVFFQKSATGVLVNEGNLSIVNNAFPDQSIDVSGGFTTVVPADQPPQGPRPSLDVELQRHEAQTTLFRPLTKEDPSQIKGVVVKLSGEAKVKRVGKMRWAAVKLHDVIGTGDQIKTEESGMVEIRLDNGNIITLKPNSTIIFTKLIWDLKTGDYENLLVVNIGRIRAKVEKLKGDSKFEIKTPTAVAAVRGTWVYLDVLPGMTRVFYEGGGGTLTSLISQISKVVGDGQTSSADDQGNVSDSTDAADEQKSDWQSGWDPGETQGYSPPEGGADEFADYEEGEGEGEGGADTPDIGDTGGEPPVDVPPEPDSGGGTPSGPTGLTGTSDGEYYASLEGDGESSIQATISSTDVSLSDPPDAEDPEDFPTATVSGTYSNPNNSKIWLGDARGQDSSGGTYEGWMAGTWLSWEGMLNGLYIDSAGKAGLIGGDFSGKNTATTFTGEGKLNYQPITDTEISPLELADSIVNSDPGPGRFWSILGDSEGISGYIIGEEDRAYKNIADEPWGIYSNIYNATYYTSEGGSEFTGLLQGYNDEGLFVSLLMGEDDSDDSVRMELVGPYVTYDKVLVSVGSLLGTYTEGNSFDLEAVELGIFVEERFEEPLSFLGFWGPDIETLDSYFEDGGALEIGSLYHDFSGDITLAGEECGIISGETPPWSGETDISLLGFYYAWEEEPYIWNTPIYSYNPEENNYTTSDGGAFYGFSTGIWDDGFMDGGIASIYLAPTEVEGIYDAGYLRGSIEGEYDSGTYMWIARGALTPEPIESGVEIDPASLGMSPPKGDIPNGRLSGDFDGLGVIEGNLSTGETISLDEDSNWGIYDIKFGDGNTYFNPDPTTYTSWSAVAGGVDEDEYEDIPSYWFVVIEEGIWQDGYMTADVSGTILSDGNLGTIEGRFYGLNNETDGTWIGASIGTWQEELLTFSGYWGDFGDDLEGGSLYYYNEGGYLGYAGFERGLIGSTVPNWWNEERFSIIAMGEYYDEVGAEAYIWNTPIYSYNPEEKNYTTQDGAAFFGYTAGFWGDEEIEGALVSLYMDPNGDVGRLTGNVYGNYYPGLEMWLAEAEDIVPTRMAQVEDLEIDPGNFGDYVDWGELKKAEVEGFFGDWDGEIEGWSEWGETAFIHDGEENQPWGIYDIKFVGQDSYENPYSDTTWFTFIEGEGEFGYEEGKWLGGMGGIWLDGKIRGSLSGLYMTEGYEGYNVGLISGDVFGLYDELEDYYGTWIGESIGIYTEMGTTPRKPDLEDLEGFDFYGEGITSFDGGSLEEVAIEGFGLEISDQDWGIWGAGIEAEYNNPDGLEDWRGDMAVYFDEEMLFVGSVEGNDLLDEQILRLDLLLYAFDGFDGPESLLTLSGTAFGTYEPFDSFYYEGVGTGSFREDPLTFSGLWGDEGWSLYFNENGEIGWAGEDYGVIGSTNSDWWLDDFSFVAMGEYWLDEIDNDVSLLWNTPIYSYDFDKEKYITYDKGAFFGYTGGIWKDLTLDGTLVVLYLDPEENIGLLTGDTSGFYFPFFDETWFATGTLTPMRMASVEDLKIEPKDFEDYLGWGEMDGEFEGAFLDYVMNGDRDGFDWEVQGLINGWSDWGETAFIYDGEESQPWGIYDLKLMGPDSYDKPIDSSNLWVAFVNGEGEFGYPGDGWYLGMAGGIWDEGGIYGALRGLYVMDELPGMASAGLIKGDIFGLYDEVGVDYGTWIGESIGIFTEMDTSENYTSFNGLEFYGTGSGSFEGGGSLEDASCYGFSLSLIEQNWGIWSAITGGNWSEPTSPWQLALGGAPYDDGDYMESWPIVWFGTVNGDEWGDQKLFGDFRGFWFTSIEDGDGSNVTAGKITGEVVGTYIDVPDGTDTWQSIGVGEWVEVTDLLTEGEGHLGFEMEDLRDFVSVPITETYTNLLTGAGGFDTSGSIQGIMDISIYDNAIWAALISGTYSDQPPTVESWYLQFSNSSDVANLTGDLWDGGEWHAAVDGVVNDRSIAGEAAGTYDGGTFEGIGAGTVE